MALSAGSVAVAADGTVSGSGYARTLYALEAASYTNGAVALEGDLDAAVAAYPVALEGGDRQRLREGYLAWRQRTATKCNAAATALVAFIQTATVTTTVPSTPGTFPGVVT